MILRFRGSSWELKIDPKTFQERTENKFEKHRTRRGDKKGNKNDNMRKQEVTTIIGKSNFRARGSLGRTTYQRNMNEQIHND